MIKTAIREVLASWSLRQAIRQQRLSSLFATLEGIVPDIADQYSRSEVGAYWRLNVRALHAFQVSLMLENFTGNGRVVDIGDSSGTHMRYLRALREGIETLSVNLDSIAVDKIRAKGLPAQLSRAECLQLEVPADRGVCFEMVEHLHDPALFLRRLAWGPACQQLIVTVPFLRRSRVGLHHLRQHSEGPVYAEGTHIFELSPEDWTLLFRHAGWRVAKSHIYYQYPRWWPITPLLRWFWRRIDFEGFWGVVLEKDRSALDRYQDWG